MTGIISTAEDTLFPDSGWYELDGYSYYFRGWGGAMNVPCVIDGVRYVFDSNGHLVEKDLDAEVGVKTVKNFLKMRFFR